MPESSTGLTQEVAKVDITSGPPDESYETFLAKDPDFLSHLLESACADLASVSADLATARAELDDFKPKWEHMMVLNKYSDKACPPPELHSTCYLGETFEYGNGCEEPRQVYGPFEAELVSVTPYFFRDESGNLTSTSYLLELEAIGMHAWYEGYGKCTDPDDVRGTHFRVLYQSHYPAKVVMLDTKVLSIIKQEMWTGAEVSVKFEPPRKRRRSI